MISPSPLPPSLSEKSPVEQARLLLTPLHHQCLPHEHGWWSYWLCYGKDVRQFHGSEETAIANNDIFILGQGQPRETVTHDGDKQVFVQHYEDGTICDLTGLPRKIDVQYECPQQKRDAFRIHSIREVATCHYVMIVYAYVLCAAATFQHKLPPTTPVTCALVNKL